MREKIKVLMVCHGSICRSPMAQFVLQDMVDRRGLTANFYIDSAATSYEEIGNPIYPPARHELQAHGVACEGHTARKLVREDFEEFDYLIAMDGNNLRNIHREFGDKMAERVTLLLDYTDTPGNIADPWYSGEFHTTYKEVKSGCEGFLTRIKSK